MQYKLKDPKPLGDRDEKYGQTFWSQTHDSDKPVMFNLMSGSVGDGAVISFEESVNKQSAKGTDYLRLRKVKIEETGHAPVINDDKKLLELVYDDTQAILKLLRKDTPTPSLSEAWAKTTDTVVDVDPEEKINLDEIPF